MAKQYPACLLGKSIRIVTTAPERIRGKLAEIQEYSNKVLLIIELVGFTKPVVVNFDHIVSIEEEE